MIGPNFWICLCRGGGDNANNVECVSGGTRQSEAESQAHLYVLLLDTGQIAVLTACLIDSVYLHIQHEVASYRDFSK